MSVGTVESLITEVPAGAWGYHVVLGLIGTAATGTALEHSLHSSTIGAGATSFLLGATALAFTAAYLEANEMDARGGR
ncbi:hypothetical protein EXE43_05640 [Halorubrum sp. SS5]|nr:hypothetical protein EXE43_05640 [Halorubrum sp. SS5]